MDRCRSFDECVLRFTVYDSPRIQHWNWNIGYYDPATEFKLQRGTGELRQKLALNALTNPLVVRTEEFID